MNSFELDEQIDRDLNKNRKVDYLIEHEALHSTNIVVEILEDHLMNHHYYNSNINPEYNALIDEAGAALSAAYQSVGQQMHFDNEENNIKKVKLNRIINPILNIFKFKS